MPPDMASLRDGKIWLALGFAVLCGGCSLTLDFDGLSDAPACRAGCQQVLEPGSHGAGLIIPWDRLPKHEIVAGFLEGEELVVAVRVHGNLLEGAVLSVNIRDGTRRLISGELTDTSGQLHTRGYGDYLKHVRALARRGDGRYLVHLWEGGDLSGVLIEIEPATGNRNNAGSVGQDCPELLLPPINLDSALDPQGVAYVPVHLLQGYALARLGESSCEYLDLGTRSPARLAFEDGVPWVMSSDGALLQLDAAGDPQVVSSSRPPAHGSGPALGDGSLAFGPDEIWTVGSDPEVFFTKVDTLSGDRTRIAGPPPPAGEPLQNPPNLWPSPDTSRLYLELDGAILEFDPTSSASRLLSY